MSLGAGVACQSPVLQRGRIKCSCLFKITPQLQHQKLAPRPFSVLSQWSGKIRGMEVVVWFSWHTHYSLLLETNAKPIISPVKIVLSPDKKLGSSSAPPIKPGSWDAVAFLSQPKLPPSPPPWWLSATVPEVPKTGFSHPSYCHGGAVRISHQPKGLSPAGSAG